MESEEREIVRLWRIYKTIHEMVQDRGYIVSKTELEQPLEEFKDQFSKSGTIDRNALCFLIEHSENSSDQLLVFFCEDESVGIKPIRKIVERMVSQSIFKGIIVYQKSMTPSATKVIQEMAPKYQLESFQENEIIINITKHVLVPAHQVLSEEAKQTLLKRYRLKDTQLPRILSSDPIARYYGLKRGQVVKIVRPSETAGKYKMKNFTILTRCLRMNQCKRLSALSPGLPLSPVPTGSAKTGKWSRVGVGIFGLGILSLDLYYYLYHYQVIKCLDEDEYQEFQVLDIDKVNHDTFKIKVETRILDLIKSQPIPCPAHVSVKDDSCQIARSYTPIQVDRESITLLVKRYANGSVSRMLTNLKNGDKVWLRGLIPTFTYTPNRVDSLIMIAGGTGITPMYQLASSILKSDQNTQITLLYANKSKNDILLKSELDELASKYPKFTIKYTLEDYDSEWDQGKGRITRADLKDFTTFKDSIAFIVCGPLGLIESIAGPRISNDDQGHLGGYLKELGFQDGQVLKL